MYQYFAYLIHNMEKYTHLQCRTPFVSLQKLYIYMGLYILNIFTIIGVSHRVATLVPLLFLNPN